MRSRVASWVVVGLSLALVLGNSQGDDWNRFRGPNGSAVSDAKDLPTEWDTSKNIRWTAKLPGPGSSSPIVVGDKVFVTSFTGVADGDLSKLARSLICVSLKTGDILWEKSVEAKQPEDRYNGFLQHHGYATSTPTSDGKLVFVFYGKSGALAYDLEGNEKWRADLGTGSGYNRWGSGSSPVHENGVIYVNAAAESKTIYALKAEDGSIVWKAPADNVYASWSTPVFVDAPDGGREMVISAPHEVWGMDAKSGQLKWFADGVQDSPVCGSPVIHDGVIYVAGGRRGSAVAIRPGGKDDANKTHVLWSKSLAAYVPSPVVVDGKLLAINQQGVAACLDLKSGESTFQSRVAGAAGMYASPLAVGNNVYLVTRRGGTLVIDMKDQGKTIAKNPPLDATDFNASPAIAGDMMLLRSNERLYAIGKSP